MEPIQHLQNSGIEFLEHVGMEQHAASLTHSHIDQIAASLQSSDERLRFIRIDIGPPYQVCGRKPGKASEPGDSQCTLLGVAAPEAFDSLQHFDVPSANFLGDWL